MTTTLEQEIHAVIDERVTAVQAKDAGPLAAREADDVVSFDVLPPLNARGKDAVAEKTQAWFDSYASAIATTSTSARSTRAKTSRSARSSITSAGPWPRA